MLAKRSTCVQPVPTNSQHLKISKTLTNGLHLASSLLLWPVFANQ